MTFLLRHRGPDEFGTAVPAPGIGLAHSRLRVIDLSDAARQPMTNSERSVWLCFNGEIYNFPDLRKELESKGFSFRSRSDTEVILHAYEAWESEAIARLDGMFAIALWDNRRQELLLARDRTGKKPLYYWTDGRCLTFGSEIKAFRAHSHVPMQINEAILPELLAFGYPPSGKSCYKQIRQVEPASWLRFLKNQAEPVKQQYWTLPEASTDPDRPLEETASQFRNLMTDAVRRRLISDVPLGAFLSGGLDSTLVVGLMSQLLDRPVKTFSIGFEGDPRFDETSYAQIAAEHFRTDHASFIVEPQPFELLEEIAWHLDQPFGDSSTIPTYLLCKLTRSQVTVALNGDGGDELFAGYERFRAALLSERIPGPVRIAGDRILHWLPLRAHPRSFLGRLRRFMEPASGTLEERFLRWTRYFQDSERILNHPAGTSSPNRILKLENGVTPLQRLLRLNFQDYLPNDLHVKMDRCSMAHGLETRSPFLDTPMVEWAFRLPDSYKLRGGMTKWILRYAFRDLLPAVTLHRHKMGFGVPLDVWFRKKWRDPMQDYLVSPGARLRRYFRQDSIQRLIRSHLEGREQAGHRLWLLLSFELWLRQVENASDRDKIVASVS